SFLNSGERIDFVDAARYNGTSSDYGSSANWDALPDNPADSVVPTAPSGSQNFIVEQNATLVVSSDTTSRSLGILDGTTTLTLNEDTTLTLSESENGTLFVESGATANVESGSVTTGTAGTLDAALLEAAGTVNLSTVANLNGGANPHPVRDGSGSSRYGLVVHSGGEVTLESGADVTVGQPDPGTYDTNVGVRIGEGTENGAGVLNIESGAGLTIFTDNSLESKGFFHIGDWGSTGIVNQTGGSVTMTDGALNLGNQGGFGTYNLSGGTLNLSGGLHSLGRNTGSRAAGSGTINLTDGTFTVSDNGAFIVGDRDDSDTDGSGLIEQSGGIFRVEGNSLLYLGGYGASTYNLSGGALEIGGSSLKGNYSSSVEPYEFNLGGGTIRVIESDLSTSVDMTLVDLDPSGDGFTVSSLDTQAFDATLSGDLSGDSVLAKLGTGTLNLSGTTDVFSISVLEGTVAIAEGTHTVDVFHTGADSDTGSDGSLEVSGGTLNITGPTVSGERYPAFYVGGGGTDSGKNVGTMNFSGGTINIGEESDPSIRADVYIGGFGGADSEGTV
ncbi:MAG: hypothetical protein ACQKBT_00845, partial [Puniceicoccales bacterium]